MPGAGSFGVTQLWGPQLPARSKGSLPQEGGGSGDPGGQDRALGGLCSGRALSSAASFIPAATSQPGCRQSRDLEGKNHQDGSVQCWAYPCP